MVKRIAFVRIECPTCRKQIKTDGPVFHCSCGELLQLPLTDKHETLVLHAHKLNEKYDALKQDFDKLKEDYEKYKEEYKIRKKKSVAR